MEKEKIVKENRDKRKSHEEGKGRRENEIEKFYLLKNKEITSFKKL